MFIRKNRHLTLSLASIAVLSLCSCSNIKSEAKYPSGLDRNQTGGDANIYGEKESIFGKGNSIFSTKKKKQDDGSNIGVNSFLWRASLDTVSFMPLASADPFGGVILTDWYNDPALPNERVKLNVFILGRELKSDGIRVRTFRQVLTKSGWQDAEVAKDTARKLEDSILLRARQLRVSGLSGEK